MSTTAPGIVVESVKNYYGKVLTTSSDLKTSACSKSDAVCMTPSVKSALASVHSEVKDRYYGCGLVLPEHIEGITVLDLGSGSGRDCYTISKLVGPKGRVIGVDMTEEQLTRARKYLDYHSKLYGYDNVEFRYGYIEDLLKAGVEDNSVDLIVSNCVINLTVDKDAVLREAHRVLKVGGEIYISDIFRNKSLPLENNTNELLWGEGLGGALYWQSLLETCKDIGFSSPRVYNVKTLDILNDDLKNLVGDTSFACTTIRMFKLENNNETLENNAIVDVVTYTGGVTDHCTSLKFDVHSVFKKGEPQTISTKLKNVLQISRFSENFKFETSNNRQVIVEESMNPFDILKSLKCNKK